MEVRRFSPSLPTLVRRVRTSLIAGAALCLGLPAMRGQTAPANAHLQEDFGKIPLSFEENRGQAASPAQFLSRGPGYAVYLSPDRAVLQLHKSPPASADAARSQAPPPRQTSTLAMKLVGAKTDAVPTAQDLLPGTANYFIGNDRSKWQTGLPTYGRVAYRGVYPGVDLVYYGNQRELEYDFVVAPGADARAIALQFEGATPKIDEAGDLLLAVAAGATRFHKPVVYQMVGDRKVPVEGSYQIAGGKVGFALGGYDHSRPLVIDPVLSYLTYIGGSSNDQVNAMAVDAAGSVYIVGTTNSTDYPVSNAYKATNPNTIASGNPLAIFVSKLNSTGTALVYSTYLGSSEYTYGNAIAVDAAGNAYVGGYTAYGDYPVTAGAFQTVCGGNYAYPQGSTTPVRANGCGGAGQGDTGATLTKLNPAGNALVYSTYLSGNSFSGINAVAVNAAGEAYVTGVTNAHCGPGTICPFGTFPTTVNAVQSGAANTGDDGEVFLTKFNAAGSGLVYSTRFTNVDPAGHYVSNITPRAIALDAAGNAYITGSLGSGVLIQTTTGALQTAPVATASPAFVAKFNPAGSASTSLAYATYLSGTTASNDVATGIAVDVSGNAVVTGYTSSCTWPTTPGAFSTVPGGYVSSNICSGGYLTKLNAAGSSLAWSTYTGANGANSRNNDNNDAIALAADGSVYIVGDEQGIALSPTVNPLLVQSESHFAYVKHFNAAGSAVLFSTAIGGTTDATSIPTGVAVDPSGNLYVAGYTNSSTYPVTTGVFQSTKKGGGGYTGFVARIAPTITTTTTLKLPTGTVTAGQPATFTAKVAGPAGTTTIPTGTVTFTSGSTTLGTGTLDATGTATYTAASLNGTTYTVTASYAGDSTFSSSASAPQSLVVSPAAAAITLTAPATATPGSSVTLTVRVTGSGGTPTGTVTFKDGTTTMGTATLASGSATYTTTTFAIGSHSLTASYTGDSTFAAATSSVQTLVVGLATPTVTLNAPATALAGATVTLSARVAGTTGTPTGSVTFKDGTTTLSTVALASGSASYSTSSLALGAHTITASYSGDSAFSAATSAASTVTINVPAAVSFAVSPTSLTVARGSGGTVTITGTPVGGYTGTATLACGTLPANASCLFSPVSLSFTGNNTAQSSTLTFSTTAARARLETTPFGSSLPKTFLALLLPLGFLVRRGKNLQRNLLLVLVALGATLGAVTLTGCGSSKTPITAAGAYSVPVNITADSTTTTITLSVTVQ